MSDITKTIQVSPEIHDELSEIQVWLRKTLREKLDTYRSITYPEVILFLLLLNRNFRKITENKPDEVKSVLETFLKKIEEK